MIQKIERINILPIDLQPQQVQFDLLKDHAQYGESDYSNAVRVERGITLEKAKEIAANDPEIGYFFYVKDRMVLPLPAHVQYDEEKDPLSLINYCGCVGFDNGQLGFGYARTFNEGDVVFFKNSGKWLGSAPGLADVYSKQ
jgi:hypothetical protein